MAPRTPALRPGPVDTESPASTPLHFLQSELLSAKSSWERLGVRIGQGYTEAFRQHTLTLQLMNRERTTTSYDGLMFVFSIVSVGFAGGIVGGLLSRWVREAVNDAAKNAFRSGVSGIAQQSAKDIAKVGTQSLSQALEGKSSDPYTTNSMSEIAADQTIRDNIGAAFGPLLEAVDAMIEEANRLKSPANVGQEILNNFRSNCPLLVQKPEENDIPSVKATARAAEIAMWVAWATERDWPWWNERYTVLDKLSLPDEKFQRLESVEKSDIILVSRDVRADVLVLDPVLNRMSVLGKWGAVYDSVLQYTYKSRPAKNMRDGGSDRIPGGFTQDGDEGSIFYLDLRKLRSLTLNADAQLPFRRLQGLSSQWDKTRPLQRMEFLTRFKDIKPNYE